LLDSAHRAGSNFEDNMEFFRIKHDIPFMRHALIFNII